MSEEFVDPLAALVGTRDKEAADKLKREATAAASSSEAAVSDAADADAEEDEKRFMAERKRFLAIEKQKNEALKIAAEREKAKNALVAEQRREHDDNMKKLADAGKAASKVQAEADAQKKKMADTPEARAELLRQIGLIRELLEVAPRRAVTANTSLHELQVELHSMNAQLNMERSVGMPEAILFKTLDTVEKVAAPYADGRGAAADFEKAVERSRKSTDPLERHLGRAMTQLSIKYSTYLQSGPEMYVAFAYFQAFKQRVDDNAYLAERARAQETEQEEADDIGREFAEAYGSGDGGSDE
jgi:chromosome segregation ATPase